jgi:endonuclease G
MRVFPKISAALLLAASPLVCLAAGFADCPQFFPDKPPAVSAHSRLRELCFDEFAVLHSGETKTPVYVVQRLNARQLAEGQGLKRKDRFYAEARLPQADRAQLGDYKHSGYSRGHMAPAGDMATPEGKAQSFSLANMAPQDPKHNGGAWSRIEQDTRAYVRRAAGDVFVMTGPIFEGPEQTIGEGRVRVPQGFFKLVFDPQTGRSWAHVQDNAAGARMGAPLSYAQFVQRTGLDFLAAKEKASRMAGLK